MTTIKAASRRDFAFATRANMKVNARGALVLTSKNHAPNPRLIDVLEDGTPEGYAPFDVRHGPLGKNIYIAAIPAMMCLGGYIWRLSFKGCVYSRPPLTVDLPRLCAAVPQGGYDWLFSRCRVCKMTRGR